MAGFAAVPPARVMVAPPVTFTFPYAPGGRGPDELMVVLLVGGKGLGIGGTGSVCTGMVAGVPYVAPPLTVMPFPLLQVPTPPIAEEVVPFTLVPVPSTVMLPLEP